MKIQHKHKYIVQNQDDGRREIVTAYDLGSVHYGEKEFSLEFGGKTGKFLTAKEFGSVRQNWIIIDEFKLEVGKYYKLNNGNKLKFIHHREADVPAMHIGIEYRDGAEHLVSCNLLDNASHVHVIDYWREKIAVKKWAAVYKDGKLNDMLFDSKEDAMRHVSAAIHFIELTGEYEA